MSIFTKQSSGASSVFKLLAVAAALIWGLGFVVMKDAVDIMPPAYLLGFRFTLAGIILGAVFFKKVKAFFNKDHLIVGGILGVIFYLAFWVQTIGLLYTTPGKNAFLTATYCVMVPFLCWVIARKKPSVYNILAAVLCIAGVGLVSLQDSMTMGIGDILTVVSAFGFAIHMVFVSKWSSGRDVLVLTVFQFLAAGICGLVMGIAFETMPPVQALVDPGFLVNMAYLVVFASCLALAFQNVALKHISASQVSLLLSLESVFGVLFSVLLYNEVLTLKLLAGFVLIFGAIVISETFPLRRPQDAREEQYSPDRDAGRGQVDRRDSPGEDTQPPLHRRGLADTAPIRQNAAEID